MNNSDARWVISSGWPVAALLVILNGGRREHIDELPDQHNRNVLLTPSASNRPRERSELNANQRVGDGVQRLHACDSDCTCRMAQRYSTATCRG